MSDVSNKNRDFNIINRNFNAARRKVRPGNVEEAKSLRSPLTNMEIPNGEFLNREILPHFGREVKQNMSLDQNNQILSMQSNPNYLNKTENSPLFTPLANTNSTFGTNITTELNRERMYSSKYRTNTLPFEQIIVGKGIGNGYDSKPTGGFHPDYRAHILPKGIDELRTASNQKKTYNGVLKSGKAVNNKRALEGRFEKRTPDTFYVQNPENYLKTTGSIKKEELRPAIYIKDNNRMNSINYTPNANPVIKAGKNRALYKSSTKNIYTTDGPRNIHSSNAWKNSEFGDYGKAGISNNPTEKSELENKSTGYNFSSIVKAIVAPFLDVLKPTKKENFIGNSRPTGNLTQGIPKNTTRDDVALPTTMKEINIENNRSGAIKGFEKPTHYDPSDVLKTTIKETNIENSHNGNLKGKVKLTPYDPSDVTRTTIKETNIENSHNGNLTGKVKLTPSDPSDVARTTIKETNIENSHNGNLRGVVKLTPYDSNDVARTTIKETNIENSHTGQLTGPVKLGVYDPNDLVSTNRQFTSNHQYSGNAENQHRGLGYITNVKNAPNTNRQDTGDNEYSGTAGGYYKKTTVYDSSLGARINETKEKTLFGRKPTPESIKMAVGGDRVHVTNTRLMGNGADNEPGLKKIIMNTYNDNIGLQNKAKHQYDNTILDERINPILLKPFNTNPLTQSLSSI